MFASALKHLDRTYLLAALAGVAVAALARWVW